VDGCPHPPRPRTPHRAPRRRHATRTLTADDRPGGTMARGQAIRTTRRPGAPTVPRPARRGNAAQRTLASWSSVG
jgi:hypothetical protein